MSKQHSDIIPHLFSIQNPSTSFYETHDLFVKRRINYPTLNRMFTYSINMNINL